MRYDLPAIARQRTNPRRSTIPIRPIVPPAMFATDLYRAIYAPVVDGLGQIGARVAAEYDRTLSAVVTDSAADIQATADEGASFLERLVLNLLPGLTDWVVRTERWHRGKWRGAVLTATGIDLDTTLTIAGQPQSVEDFIAWNTSLVKDVAAQGRARIGNAVFSAVQQRKPTRELAADIRNAVAMSKRRSMLIASDQTMKLTGALDRERRTEAGITIYRYRHSGKKHARHDHKARDGKLYAENAADAGKVVGGETVNPPLAPENRASVQPYCGCREAAVLVLD